MYKHSVYRCKKGYIIVYVMFIGILILIMLLTAFRLEFERYKVMSYKKYSVENENIYNYKKEKVFVLLYNQLIKNNVDIEKSKIIEEIEKKIVSYTITYEDVQMSFDDKTEVFILVYPYDKYRNCYEYYDLLTEGSKFKMNLINSEIKMR